MLTDTEHTALLARHAEELAAKDDALTIMRRTNNELGEHLAARDAEIARLREGLGEILAFKKDNPSCSNFVPNKAKELLNAK